MNPKCPYMETCSGCDRLSLSYDQQKAEKLQEFQEYTQIPDATFHSFGENGLRHRLDFGIQNGKIGLFKKGSKDIVDIERCLQLHPDLQKFYDEFRKFKWPFQKGSVRLRVSPLGQKGVWLDLANDDIKKLLDEKTTLEALRKRAVVEIGQRHKSLMTKKDGSLGLGDPVLNTWFETWQGEKSYPLKSTVAAFTQPSLISNKGITQTISQWVVDIQPRHILEFGSGIGNLTIPALTNVNTQLTATDWDERALEVLKANLESAQLNERVRILKGDFRKHAPQISDVDLLLLNPARSGVGNFLQELLPLKPQHILYMSCFVESFALDTQALKSDYSPKKVILMDQFPGTRHVEVLSLWTRVSK